ncbi:hypothetical protein WICMUC_001932 [Wickerhamomyces mucosus]|uniref:Uncharacterized protein n=1 Tax=Wickerhamomyces mucosus TaxID=1378264 RepID=A0A9P8TFJ3_9ASCO|nr:hypothetical protein WICMUC_001932 [Wickerhamomyces mucosus]
MVGQKAIGFWTYLVDRHMSSMNRQYKYHQLMCHLGGKYPIDDVAELLLEDDEVEVEVEVEVKVDEVELEVEDSEVEVESKVEVEDEVEVEVEVGDELGVDVDVEEVES